MRFKKCAITKEPYKPNPARRLAAAVRYINKEKDRFPLFANQIVTETPEQRVAFLDDANRRWATEFRRHEAEIWFRCRKALSLLPADVRLAIREEWDAHP